MRPHGGAWKPVTVWLKARALVMFQVGVGLIICERNIWATLTCVQHLQQTLW